MNMTRSKTRGYRRAVSPLVSAIALVLCVPQLQAQESAAVLERIDVTGSRIKKAAIEGQVPVQIVSREDIERTGLTSVGDILQRLTGSGAALNTKFNSSGNFGFPPDGGGVGAGSAQADLRHLGSKRVLVLVDGVRWVNEASASGVGGSTDLNTIPLAIVERIEILEDGASSIYGSDAIAGVVNIITRREFDGMQIKVNYGEFEEGDGQSSGVDLAWGGSSDRAKWFLGASFVDQEQIDSKDRAQSAFPRPGGGIAFGSAFTPTGRFLFRDPNTNRTLDLTPNTGNNNPIYNPAQTGCVRTDGFHCFTSADRFNFSTFNLLLTPSERTGLFGQFRFDIDDTTSWYVKALYNQRRSTNQAAPEPIQIGPAAGNAFANRATVSRLNPFNPFGFDLISSGPGANLTFLGRRPVEGGARVFEQEVDTQYFGTGLEGMLDIGERTYLWDLNAASSTNRAEQTNFGSYNILRIVQALGTPASCAAIPGCVPLNIFGGPGTITPAMLAWIQPIVRDQSENKLQLFSANITGDVFELPAGPMSFASGYEYRKYQGFYQPDQITVRGEYNGVPSLRTAGEYDVNEVYTEFSVPLLADVAAFKKLDLSLAGRYSDYSTSGGEFTSKVGLRWQVVDELLLRASAAEGFRAPSIGELFGSPSRFDAQLLDPCLISTTGLPPTGNAAYCRGLGVPDGAVQVNNQISVATGGNINLQPELADSLSAGLVWSPQFAQGSAFAERLDFEATYYQHELEGAIEAIDAQTQLNLCVLSQRPEFCTGITRANTGAINQFNNFLTNFSTIETAGWDFDVFWVLPDSDWGQMSFAWQNTRVNRYQAVGGNGAVQPRTVGVELNNSAIPEWTSNLTADWKRGAWSVAWATRYIDGVQEVCPDARLPCTNPAPANIPSFNTLGATTYHDLQTSYTVDTMKGLKLTAGVNNLFDKQPPICLTCSLNGYDASTYDLPSSRNWYVSAEIKF